MTLANEIGELEDKVLELTTRLSQCEKALAFERGKNEQLNEINAKLQFTIGVRETALALHEAGARQMALAPMEQPQLQLPQRLPDTPANANSTELPQLPQFLERRTDEHRGRKASA